MWYAFKLGFARISRKYKCKQWVLRNWMIINYTLYNSMNNWYCAYVLSWCISFSTNIIYLKVESKYNLALLNKF
jgi:hypothetical protein